MKKRLFTGYTLTFKMEMITEYTVNSECNRPAIYHFQNRTTDHLRGDIVMMRLRLLRAAYAVMSLTLLLAGCQSKPETVKARSGLSAVKVQRIALMPFVRGLHNSSLGDPMNRLLYCTMSNLCFNIKEVKGNADELMTGILQEALQKRYAGALVPDSTVQAAYAELAKYPVTDTPLSLAIALGRKLQVDHVMVGIVWRYKERVGTAEASPSPASVAFTLYLLNVAQGTPVWQATFDKTQQALSENLLNAKDFFSMGARWLTADELASFGIKKVLEEPGGVL